ncbi:MAG: class I SAM-dependent methyltransferase [Anaerovoracaceae bacterium]|jgi:SAM-dependent methyltransferase
MDYTKKKMTEVADNPRGLWGKKMLARMHDRHGKLIKWGLSDTDLSKYHDILDIGCGSGNALSYMYKQNKKAHYFGIDYSKDAVKTAKKNNRAAVQKGHMKIIHGDVCDMPYRPSSFDLIISVESFYYWKNFDKAMAGIAKVMKKGARLVIILETHADIKDPSKNDEVTGILTDMMIPSKDDFKSLFEAAGLSLEIETSDDWIRATGTRK